MPDSKARTAVFFTTDYGFLIPTLVAALQVRTQMHAGAGVDILIFLVDFQGSQIDRLREEFAPNEILFIDFPSALYDNEDLTHYHESHIPKSALARLCVGNLIPDHYNDLIYLDGDVQIAGDLGPLVRFEVPDGYILASLDQGLFEIGEPGSSVGEWYRRYTTGLGLANPMDYFNTGVIAIKRTTLLQMGPAALKYIQQNSEHCIQHDQSALNAVCKNRRIYMSPLYNFMPRFRETGVGKVFDPVIIHFADRLKPWHEPVRPWMVPYSHAYREIVERHPVLKEYLVYLKRSPSISSYAPGRLKLVFLKLLRPLRLILRRRKFEKYMAQTPFAFE